MCCDDSTGVVVNGVKPAGANWAVAGSYAQTTLFDAGNPGAWSVSADVHGFQLPDGFLLVRRNRRVHHLVAPGRDLGVVLLSAVRAC